MPTDVVDNGSGTTVLDILRQKHPSAQPPRASSLVPCDDLPLFEDVNITDFHLLFVAHHIQGVLYLVVVMLVTGGMYCFGLALICTIKSCCSITELKMKICLDGKFPTARCCTSVSKSMYLLQVEPPNNA